MRYMLRDKKVTTISTDQRVTTPSVPLGRTNSNKVKLETARRSSLAVCNVGKPPLAPMPMAIKQYFSTGYVWPDDDSEYGTDCADDNSKYSSRSGGSDGTYYYVRSVSCK